MAKYASVLFKSLFATLAVMDTVAVEQGTVIMMVHKMAAPVVQMVETMAALQGGKVQDLMWEL